MTVQDLIALREKQPPETPVIFRPDTFNAYSTARVETKWMPALASQALIIMPVKD
jgi:hypothetical protein